MKQSSVELLCASAISLLRNEEGLCRCMQPLLTCVVLAEMFEELSHTHPKTHYRCYSVNQHILEVAEEVQSAIKDEETLVYLLLKQTDLRDRSAIEIIAENKFFSLLKDDNVASIVSRMWFGDGQTLSIGRFSHMFKYSFASLKQGTYKSLQEEVSGERLYWFNFQYESFISNCSVRFIVDSISTVMATFLYQLLIYSFVSIHKHGQIELFSTTETFFTDPEATINYPTVHDPFENDSFLLINTLAIYTTFSISINVLASMVYSLKTTMEVKFNWWLTIDMMMLLCNLLNYMQFAKTVFPEDKENEKFFFALNYSLIVFLAWGRVLAILLRTKTFGPFIRIVYMLTGLMFNFIIIYFCVNMMFAEFFTVFFYRTVQPFHRIWDAWKTLFQATFAVYDFDIFPPELEMLGSFFFVVYITITQIMLLNLIIAIINNQYVIHTNEADSENRAILVNSYKNFKWNKEWGLLILLPAPLNLISFPFSLVLLVCGSSRRERLNNLFSKLCYSLIAGIYFLILLGGGLLLYPFALIRSYILSSYSSFNNIAVENENTDYLVRPFYFLYLVVKDCFEFLKLVYKEKKDNTEERTKRRQIEIEMVHNFREFLKEYKSFSKKAVITVDEAYFGLGLKQILSRKKEGDRTETTLMNSRAFSSTTKMSGINDLAEVTRNKLFNGMNDRMRRKKALVYRFLADKMADKDKQIDIDRTLALIPEEALYSEEFFEWLGIFNVKSILRGLQNHFFMNTVYNPVFYYRQLSSLVTKVDMKMKMLVHFIPENLAENMRKEFDEVNTQYLKKKKLEDYTDFVDDELENPEDELKQYSQNYLSSRSKSFRSHNSNI